MQMFPAAWIVGGHHSMSGRAFEGIKIRSGEGLIKTLSAVLPPAPMSDGNGRGVQFDAATLLAGLRHAIEEINEPGLKRVLGAYDQKSVSLDQFFEDLRSVSQMVRGDANVGTNGLPH